MPTGWVLVVVFNLVTAAAYLGIVGFILRGLGRTRQLRHNRLAVATAAIFLTCAAHHVLHAVHLSASPTSHAGHGVGESAQAAMNSMRDSMGGVADVTVTAATALAGMVYLGLRRSYSVLLRSPAMFGDMSETWYRQLAANLPHTVVFVVDTDLRFVLAEGAGLIEAGYERRLMEGRLLSEVVPPDVYAHLEPHYRSAVAGVPSQFDSISDITGKIFHVQARPLRDDSGRLVGALVLAEDVTAEREAKAELERARAFRDAVLTASPDITTVTDVESGEVTWTSRSLSSLVGDVRQVHHPSWPGFAGVGDDASTHESLVLAEDLPSVRTADATILSLPDGESSTIRFRVRTGAGDVRWLSRSSTPFRRGPDGAVTEVLSVVREVTDVVVAELALEQAALHDPLTGLPNRILLLERIRNAIERGGDGGVAAAVLFCDLDGFKRINDTGGHAAGDAVLVEVSRRLRSVLRVDDSIARVGGDEFVLVIDVPRGGPVVDGQNDIAGHVAERVRAVLTAPIRHQGAEYVVTVSIGMVMVDRRITPQEALRDADSAMYQAKQQGKNRIELFDDALRARALDRAHIEQSLRDALDPGCATAVLGVAYQPIYRLHDGRIIGFEALARLRDADGRDISPSRFIPVAEETGLIATVGVRILDDALTELKTWRSAHPDTVPDGVPATVSVNISAVQVKQTDLTAMVEQALARHGLEPSGLVLELTESVLLESESATLRQLGELRASGVGIAIDDFGTGYASLRYLVNLPVSSVKIDRSFTGTMTSDPTSNSIVRAIIALARDLELACVVEGIETVEQLNSLPGSVQGQGFLLGRPAAVPADSWKPAHSY